MDQTDGFAFVLAEKGVRNKDEARRIAGKSRRTDGEHAVGELRSSPHTAYQLNLNQLSVVYLNQRLLRRDGWGCDRR
jgi:hypothetical protein